MLKYRCLILHHDDTVVMSTPTIHYPAHVETLRRIRPHTAPVSLDEWYQKNFHPGLMAFLRSELQMTEEELETEFHIWREFTTERVPEFYPGMFELLQEYRKRGGIITVVSHSEEPLIERDYSHASQDAGIPPFLPDRIFGWTQDPTKRKPNPYPGLQILREFSLDPSEVLLLDDLKPGIEMAKALCIDTAAAGWAHNIEEIRTYMQLNCTYYFQTVEEFRRFLLEEEFDGVRFSK